MKDDEMALACRIRIHNKFFVRKAERKGQNIRNSRNGQDLNFKLSLYCYSKA
jgi:hypothetical protein